MSHISVGSMVINNQCYESYPCQHGVTIDGMHMGLWSGAEIAAWIEDRELDVPDHFRCYLEKHVRRHPKNH